MQTHKMAVVAGALKEPSPSARMGEIALSGVYEISKILARPARLEIMLSNVLNLLSSYLDMQHGTIMLIDDEGTPEIVVGTCWTEVNARAAAPLPQAALDQIIATGMPLVVENLATHPLFTGCSPPPAQRSEPGAASFIGVPIKIETRVAGTLSIDRPRGARASPGFDNDLRFLSMIANLIGQTIHLHRVIARDRERLMEDSRRLEKELTIARPDARPAAAARVRAGGIVGDSAPIRALLDKITVVAKSNATVLLRGESGTGKELFARAIHELSPRTKKPFVKVNCAALPETVLESELFGHEKGAFTGALQTRKGRFELADTGTIFLDEIGEISASFQAKLLRVLQEGEFDKVGSSHTQKVDVRVVAATNRNLEDAVARGTFRADLYYRIAVVPLVLPPLRDRKGDIPALARRFLNRFNKENGRELELSAAAIDVLKSCYFPGNVRELENCVYRTATLAKGGSIEARDFACGHGECLSAVLWKAKSHSAVLRSPAAPPAGFEQPAPHAEAATASCAASCHGHSEHGATKPCTCGASEPGEGPCPSPDICTPQSIRVTRDQLYSAMERSGWVQAKAARILGLTPRQIGYALKKHDIPIKRF